VVSPLASLDHTTARLLWLGLSLLLLAAALLALKATIGLRLGPGWRGPALALVALFPPVFDDLLKGQVSTLLLCLLCSATLLVRRAPLAAGSLVALAAGVKLAPGLLAAQFGLRRQYRACLGAMAAGGALGLLSLLVAGWPRHVEYVTQTLPSVGHQVGAAANISLPGLVARLFDPGSLVPPLWPNANLAGVLTPLALVALGALYIRAVRNAHTEAEALGLTVIALLLATPSSQAYTLTLALVPIAALIARSQMAVAPDWRLFDLTVLAVALLSVPPDLRLDPAMAASLGVPSNPEGGFAIAISALPAIGLVILGWLLSVRPSHLVS
jgi:hypothetical protein